MDFLLEEDFENVEGTYISNITGAYKFSFQFVKSSIYLFEYKKYKNLINIIFFK